MYAQPPAKHSYLVLPSTASCKRGMVQRWRPRHAVPSLQCSYKNFQVAVQGSPHTRSCSTASAEMSRQVTRFHMKRVRSHADSAAQMRASVTDTGLRMILHVITLLPLQERIDESSPTCRYSGAAHNA